MTSWPIAGVLVGVMACGGSAAGPSSHPTTPANAATDTPPPVAAAPMLEVTRGGCPYGCATYAFEVHQDGRVTWRGESSVTALGPAEATIDDAAIAALHTALAEARITERKRTGLLPGEEQPFLGRNGLPRAHIGYRLDDQLHEVDFSLGADGWALDVLLEQILEITGADAWL